MPELDQDDVTLGELARRFDRMEATINEQFKSISQRMDTQLVTREYYSGRHDALKERVVNLERQRAEDMASRRTMWAAIAVAVIADVGQFLLAHIH